MKSWSIVGLALGLMLCDAHAKDGYDVAGRPLVCDPSELGVWDSFKGEVVPDLPALNVCRHWVGDATQPQYSLPKQSRSSCCGDGDAFITDLYDTEDGKLTAIITEDYAKWGIPIGTRIFIPNERINDAIEDKNPTKHGIVFIGSSGNVLCYFGPAGQ